MSTTRQRACWRRDLSQFRGLSDFERSGFLLLLEWFENYRLRHELEAGREAAKSFWRTEVIREDREREPWQRIKRYMSRPPVQLYNTLEDPYEMKNLAIDDGYAETKAQLTAALDEWMREEADPGAKVDTVEALQASRKGEHLYGRSE